MSHGMTLIGGHERVAYTVEHRHNCVIITGSVPATAFSVLAGLAPAYSVVDPHIARVMGVNFVFGLPEDLAVLRKEAEANALTGVGDRTFDGATWLKVGERGISSNTMFTHLTGHDVMGGSHKSHPYDTADFRRCRLLLELVPSLKPLLPKMAEVSKPWADLVYIWQDICAAMDAECPSWRETLAGSYTPTTYKLIQRAIGR